MNWTLRRLLRRAPDNVLSTLVIHLEGELGYELRAWWWASRVRHMGRGVRIEPGVFMQQPQHIVLEDQVWIDRGVVLLAGADPSSRPRTMIDGRGAVERGALHVGPRTHIGPRVVLSGMGGLHIGADSGVAHASSIYSLSHGYRDPAHPERAEVCYSPRVPQDQQYMVEGPIEFGDNVGLATQVTVLPGTAIGARSFVLSGAVVRGSFPDNSLIAGTPARRLRSRFA